MIGSWISDLALLDVLPRPWVQLAHRHQRGLRPPRRTSPGDDAVIFPDRVRLFFRRFGRLARISLLRTAGPSRRGIGRRLRLHQRSPGLAHPQLGGRLAHSPAKNPVRIKAGSLPCGLRHGGNTRSHSNTEVRRH